MCIPCFGVYPDAPDREMNVEVQLKLTTVFGEPGKEDTRIGEFRLCLEDVRAIVESFTAAFP